jgi:hypothetical protein
MEQSGYIREIEEADINFDKLITAIAKAESQIATVVVIMDTSLEKYKSVFKKIKNVEFIDETKIMQKES